MRSPRNLGCAMRLFQKSADGEALPPLAVLTFLVTVIVRCCARCTQVPSTTSRASSFILVGCWTSFSVLAAQRAGPRCHTISARSSTGGAAAAAARTWVRPGSCRVSGRGALIGLGRAECVYVWADVLVLSVFRHFTPRGEKRTPPEGGTLL